MIGGPSCLEASDQAQARSGVRTQPRHVVVPVDGHVPPPVQVGQLPETLGEGPGLGCGGSINFQSLLALWYLNRIRARIKRKTLFRPAPGAAPNGCRRGRGSCAHLPAGTSRAEGGGVEEFYTTLYYKLYTTYYILYTLPMLYTHTILILYYTTLYYTILYYTILYYTILYYTILYCTVLYYTIPD